MSLMIERGVASATEPPSDLRETSQERTSVPDLAVRLLALAAEDERLTHAACELPEATSRRRAMTEARSDHGRTLRAMVEKSGWPSCQAVGSDASLAALQVLLNARTVPLLDLCQPLIADAVARRSTPAVHLAYVDDLHAVLLGGQQTYGTQVDSARLRPFPIRDAQSVDERRGAVGLPPLATSLAQTLAVMKRSR
ncbi:DUF6624 domain-containing protein [Streptomyces sp. NPDC002676]